MVDLKDGVNLGYLETLTVVLSKEKEKMGGVKHKDEEAEAIN